MEDKILVNLNTDHTFECAVDIIGREGEGGTTQLELTIPEKLIGCSVYLDFEKPNGETLRTPKLKIENGKAVYDVVQYLLTDEGEIKAQAVLITGDGKIWKSSKKKYFIQNSINALEEIPEKEDFFIVTTRMLELAESARRSVWIKYSANADGSNFTDEWSEGQNYIGFATANECPTKKNDFEWVLLPKGGKGDNGVGITDIRFTERREYYDLYTITLTNGVTRDFEVPHGKDGTNGTDGTDGKDGKTPERGVDYFTEADKSAMVVAVMEAIGCPLFGLIDENNHITFSGKNIPDGTYTFDFEMEDGSRVPGGSLVLDTNTYYSVTNSLTNCTNGNTATKVVEGKPYSATISANDGYELKSVTVTMGGANVSVTNGVINIASVTGNIVITAVAEEKISYNNLAKTITEGQRLNSSGGLTPESGRAVCEDYIPFTAGSVVRIKGFDWANNTSYNAFYDASKKIAAAGAHTFPGENGTKTIKWERESNDVWKYTNISNSVAFIRFSGVLKGTASDVIITLNEEIS